jgi:hypothetical protein
VSPAIDIVVAELCAAVEDLQRHAQGLQHRAAELRDSVDRARDTRGDVRERQRLDAELESERTAIDLDVLDQVLAHLRACLESERHEIELLAQRQRLALAEEQVEPPVVVRVRR